MSDAYQRTIRVVSWSLGLVIAYTLGGKLWPVLLLWLASTVMIVFWWAYIGKYFLPPKLSRCVDEYPSVLGLGSDHDNLEDRK